VCAPQLRSGAQEQIGENHLGAEGQGAEGGGEEEMYEKTRKEQACGKPRELEAPEREGERESFIRNFP
jgi:hypothetical protein